MHAKKILSRLRLWVFGFLVVASSILAPVLTVASVRAAEDCDVDFYSANDILFYNPCSTNRCTADTSAGLSNIALRGDTNAQKIFNFWVDSGLGDVQAAGVTGSMQHEGGFSPFRQEGGKTWPDGGWGIAQFTFDPGQRGSAVAYVRSAIGDATFNQYYVPAYGGPAMESNGFIPDGVPVDVNDKFLLAELNYLLEHIQALVPNDTRWDAYTRDWGVPKDSGTTLFNYLKTVTLAGNAAKAWTYLYEYPGDIKNTSSVRADSADQILSINSTGTGVKTECGGNLSAGGMTMEQATTFMTNYTSNPSNSQYIGTASPGCVGGPLSNCVSFSMYFINKYTSIDGTKQAGNGSVVVSNLVANNPDIGLETGHSPRPYAVFSTASGTQTCDGGIKCGHTGVVLGVDTANQKIIIGEAGCSAAASWDGAHEYPLADFDNENYTYLYTDQFLKGTVQ